MQQQNSPALEIDPESLRAAEFMQVERILSAMVGRRIVAARLEETRIAIEIEGGRTVYFYGFMGEERTPAADPGAT